MNINNNFLKLQQNYLFTEIANRTNTYAKAHPNNQLIRLGVGDVSRPLPSVVIDTIHRAVNEQADSKTFRGYGPEQGYTFLRKAIIHNDYEPRGIHFSIDEVFISDGAGSDLGNLSDILGTDNRIAIQDPVYPAYIDTNVMAGRTGDLRDGRWSNIIYLPCTAENEFCPDLPKEHADIIWLCYPNNPTGTALTREQLQRWVRYAQEHQSLIIFDSAYEAFIQSNDIPHSIYEIEGAKEVAIEIRSYSKTAGFTGIRCGYTVVPNALYGRNNQGGTTSLNTLWTRRQCTKYNGTSYISQRAAEAIYTEQGKREIHANIQYYMNNAHLIREQLHRLGYEVYGGEHAPYIWVHTPNNMPSWDFFDLLLNRCEVVATPGVGFGLSGEHYLRLTAFGTHEDTIEALRRIKEYL